MAVDLAIAALAATPLVALPWACHQVARAHHALPWMGRWAVAAMIVKFTGEVFLLMRWLNVPG